MANSRFEYVRNFEAATEHELLPNCYVVVRIDGQRFHQFSKSHHFHKPNDKRSLDLMVESAKHVIREFYPNIKLAYGQSDEFSFILGPDSDPYNRRQNKLTSLVASAFTSAYLYKWSKYFSDVHLKYPPSFDSRCVLYPTKAIIIDYLKWRQVDCHINNLYNTSFYALTGEYIKYLYNEDGEIAIVPLKSEHQPLTPQEAQKRLKGTFSKDKHDIMFLEYKINYNNELEQFKKGSLLALRNVPGDKRKIREIEKESIAIDCHHIDVIQSDFWEQNSFLLQ